MVLMKIISWNVNGLRAVDRKGDLYTFLEAHDPDILLLQETKAQPEQLEFLNKKYVQYEKFYHSAQKPGYSGVGIWVKTSLEIENIVFSAGMPGDPVAEEGRIARVDFDRKGEAYTILGTYFPNGGKSPEAWKQKLVFYKKWLDYINHIRESGRFCIWAGDINCAHHEIDLARPKDNEGVIGFHPKERALLDRWMEDGWVDIWRSKNPETRDVYSWWHVITRSRAKNVGWRIDYAFVAKEDFDRVKNIEYLTQQMGSDHCPVALTI